MIGGQETLSLGQSQHLFFDKYVFWQHHNFAARLTREVMMVIAETGTQFQFILPTDVQSLNNAELLK